MVPLQTSVQGQISDACYSRGEYRYDVDGRILNELGLPAKGRDIIMRHAKTGFPMVRFCDLTEA